MSLTLWGLFVFFIATILIGIYEWMAFGADLIGKIFRR